MKTVAENPALSEVTSIPLGFRDDGPALRKAGRVDAPSAGPDTRLATEVEPNGSTSTATPFATTSARVRGDIYPAGDVDYYSFTAAAGDKVYAATMTFFSAAGTTAALQDSALDILASDGTTVVETDDNDGSFNGNASSIAGATIPSSGTYYLRVRAAGTTTTIRPYDVYFRLQSGTPTAEVESNDSTATAQPLPASGWVSGSTSAVADVDFYSVSLNAGDTIYMGLDLSPDRVTEWNGRLGLASFGGLILVVNDTGNTGPDSEAMFFTVKSTGTYYVYVDCPATTFGTYTLSTSVFPRADEGTCANYASSNVPVMIGSGGPNTVTSTLIVPGSPRIGHLRVNLNITHTFMSDLDVALTSPDGTTISLFTDIGATTTGNTQTTLDLTLDDDNAIPPAFTVVQDIGYSPELNYRLGWLNGINAGGTWTLTIRDDATGDGGSLNSWSLDICEDTAPFCSGGILTPIFSTDFEADNGGFTHSGTADEWEWGTPVGSATNPIGSANSGANAWKTDLDSTYNASSNQELFSPQIVLPATGAFRLTWAQKYQMDTANNDHAYVEIREVGGAGSIRRLFEHLGALMTDTVGNPTATLQEASGWSLCTRDISDFAGKTVQIVWHLDSNATVQLSGFAVDDVKVEQCTAQPMADLSVTNVDSPDPVSAGSNLTYTITATNNGPDAAASATVTFPLPAGTTFVSATQPGSWTPSTPTVGSGGTVTFTNASFAVGSAVFTVVVNVPCSVANATVLSGTATAGSSTGDPSPGNDSGTATTTVSNAAPVVSCPSNITTAAATGSCDATVTYTTPTATDDTGCTATVVCSPASGQPFPVGVTTVTCTATDAASQTGSCTFTVTVNDTTAPTVACPANMTVVATGPSGATATYTTPTASDNCSGATVVCAPSSGSTFAVGVTTVTCTATDASNNTGSCTFTVSVLQHDTIGVYAPATNGWFLRNTNTTGPADVSFGYGGSSALVAIKGDWNNDGVDTPGLYDPATGTFYLRNSQAGGPADITFSFGAPNGGFTPISGDWNDDGTDSVGLYNPTTGVFFLKNTNAGGGADLMFMFGGANGGLLPIAGDWDGTGGDSIGLYNPTTGVFFLKNANAAGGADFVFTFGAAGAGFLPIAGDWNNNGTDTVGLYLPSTGGFFLTDSSPSGSADYTFVYGPPNLKPLAGNWDGQ